MGFLGPGPVDDHLRHARGFAVAWGGPPPRAALDLGSGGGVPGLVLASVWPSASWVLLDANERRTAFLDDAVRRLRLSNAVVVRARAEAPGPSVGRAAFDLVTARGFGPPAVTAECAAPLLAEGGRLIVSEPPDGDDERWPRDGLAALGLEPLRRVTAVFAYRVLVQERPCPARFPRRVGIPAKRPLF